MLVVADCPAGSVVEIIDRRYGVPTASGRCYRLRSKLTLSNSGYVLRSAISLANNEPVGILEALRCRIVENV